MGRLVQMTACLLFLLMLSLCALASEERTLKLEEIGDGAVTFQADMDLDGSGKFTFWLPSGADELVLPITAGVVVDTSHADSMKWLQAGSPWSLLELPIVGLRYGDQMVTVIAPWPHYAELIVSPRVGIRFSLPKGRLDAAPVEIVAMRHTTRDPLEVARQFRQWRETAPETGAIPRPRSFRKKLSDLATAELLLGAPHFYLWGPALFCKQDIPEDKWQDFAKSLSEAPRESFGSKLTALFSDQQRGVLVELESSESPKRYLIDQLALAINEALMRQDLLGLSPDTPEQETINQNKQAFASAYAEYVNPPETWGDGISLPLLQSLHEAGIERAVLILSDLYGRSVRPDVAAYAKKLGYLFGPYDSYHSIHPPDAKPDQTWETAQFDLAGYDSGRVINADGSGHGGFLGRGFHFSPKVAWPYMKNRVGGILNQAPYSTWFIDCDATAECFDDYSPQHAATKLQDTRLRRERLSWLEADRGMVVGSEGGSVLFADVIHFGHGVHTPYIIHLDPAFRDRNNQHFLGAASPPDTPDQEFKPTTIPPSVRSPYFDPTVRIPLYRAAVGDEVIATHHWSMDSLKFKDVAQIRELMEILYMVPPMYHLNRESWPTRRERIITHYAFWSPLHREIGPAPMTKFEILSEDRLVQRTTFENEKGDVSITVNFGELPREGYPAFSATVTGPVELKERAYIANESVPN